MSKYTFIASDFKLPEIDLTNGQIITPLKAKAKGIQPPDFCLWEELEPDTEILYFKNEDDMDNLSIYIDDGYMDDVRFYTNKKFIYGVSCRADRKRMKQLLDYILSIDMTKSIELYSIWLGDEVSIEEKVVTIDKLNEEILLKLMDNYRSCLIISNDTK